MWIESNKIAIAPVEDFVLFRDDAQKATIPLEILQKIAPGFPEATFSSILVEITDEAVASQLIPSLVNALEYQGILVVAFGDKSPNDPVAQKIIDVATADNKIITPLLMVRYQRAEGMGFGYAFRFKRSCIVPVEKVAEPEQASPTELTEQKTKKPPIKKKK